MRYLFLSGTIALLALGQVLFKMSTMVGKDRWGFLFKPPFIAALFVYAAATLMWVFTLRQWPLTIAYAAQALTICIVVAIGVVVFGENLNRVQLVGIVVILGGLLILASG